ncbi:gamma-glutamyltransferase [Fluoribacter dumoffii]|uniref:Glutathione hydrolase proenzyme n=1 Tax=Fluoribacter dumoffii TaxID=463 RepID=A0A377G673_9GAMM|nr:gamma-glutamyltransferase [Fluoribacter dumoffii]MCW8387048.1 gamma-glutamyltransferase [Fluoribacter dumoffii]MCW8417448.1 gamma-glutamyltransferase [Fluoribacter dumoffii]MCW8454710.1 gamma-glutamyltransferase [Fluoribacter dumoffii]MCW8461212.1 gamma-glutamyltransferase [Fluoribacter dumoffii]MCW8484653.1 gamma-glutamyltransferase [Fluoribacter dumoffii]
MEIRKLFQAFCLIICSIHFLLYFPLTAVAKQTNLLPPGYAIASANPLATNAGLEILSQGGNAFDAAVAVSAVLAVVEPYHSGLGGGGFWLLHQEKEHKNIFIDGRETAPLAAKEDMFLASDGRLIPELSLNGGLAAAIPGEPAALVYIAKNYGRLPLTKTLAPAIKLAEEGFLVDKQLSSFLKNKDRLEQIRKYPSTAKIFLNKGQPFQIGERFIQKDLANTLKLLAMKENQGFYAGEVAQRLVKGVNAAGGIWTLEDLARYRIKVREPLIGAFHNMLIITSPPPSAGGIALLTMLNILSHYPLSSYSKIQWIHYLAESMRLAYWQRERFLGDPDFISIPVERLLSAENGKQLSSLIPAHKALPSDVLRGKVKQKTLKPAHSSNTTHFSIIDGEGNRVSATMSINYIFGSSVVAEGTGVLLNDQMDDFATKPGEENVFGLVGGNKNAIAPGKRPLSSMTPTFLELPDRVAILGTPGGSRIPTMILIASLVFHDTYGAISMVSSMRFHHQYLPDVLQFEPDTFSPAIQDALKNMGYHLLPLKRYYGDMQAITWDKSTNMLTAASDPRAIGLAAAIVSTPSGYGHGAQF